MVRCADGSLYTGVTTDLSRRVRQHNGEILGGAKYTATRRPVTLAACQVCEDRSDALRKEYRLKQLRREAKLSWCEDNKIEKTR